MTNAPFQIVLEGNSFRREEESSLTLDTDTCSRYNIPMSFDLVGRTLICSFESRELSFKDNNFVDMNSLESDDLNISSLSKNESIWSSFGTISPSKHSKVSRTLTLSSFGGGDGIHPSPLPCPFYRVVLELTDEEYEACKVLPPNSIFKVNFRLAWDEARMKKRARNKGKKQLVNQLMTISSSLFFLKTRDSPIKNKCSSQWT